jgi:dethiobiotin synthetase
MRRIFITGIGTGVGKTIVSAIVAEALQADYWKPVQTGSIEGTDTEMVKKLISNGKTKIHTEAFCLKKPVSPHEAAAEEGISIAVKNIYPPITSNILVIEGAGGIMVPLNNKETMLDLIKVLNSEIILVVRNYLGSINHTLLSASALNNAGIKVAGIIYSGVSNPASENVIAEFCNYPVLARIGEEKDINPSIILGYANKCTPALLSLSRKS